MKPTLPPRPEPPPRPRWSVQQYIDHVCNSVPFHQQHSAMSAVGQVAVAWDTYEATLAVYHARMIEWQEQCRLCEAGGAGKVGNAGSRKTL